PDPRKGGPWFRGSLSRRSLRDLLRTGAYARTSTDGHGMQTPASQMSAGQHARSDPPLPAVKVQPWPMTTDGGLDTAAPPLPASIWTVGWAALTGQVV